MDYYPADDDIVPNFGGMNPARMLYRTRQFWQAVGGRRTDRDLELVESVLTPAEYDLFQRMSRSDQAHSIRVLRFLLEKGPLHPDLLKAALLHDVGKSILPLQIWERVIIVLSKVIIPKKVSVWGSNSIDEYQVFMSWRRGFIVSKQHAEWGAQMAAKAGVSALTRTLIRRHHVALLVGREVDQSYEERLLRALQVADEES